MLHSSLFRQASYAWGQPTRFRSALLLFSGCVASGVGAYIGVETYKERGRRLKKDDAFWQKPLKKSSAEDSTRTEDLKTNDDDSSSNALLRKIEDSVFQEEDSLMVWLFSSDEQEKKFQSTVEAFRETIAGLPIEKAVGIYSARKEKRDMDGEGDDGNRNEGMSKIPTTVDVIMHKGQRRASLSVPLVEPLISLPVEELRSFFSAVSEPESVALRTANTAVPMTTHALFRTDILDAANSEAPIVLQMFEESCFLCFLMRPMMNSIATLLKSEKVPIGIRRLNIERNDFPLGCPVARGTPTFVLFRSGTKVEKWVEFRPKDVIERLESEIENLATLSLSSLASLRESFSQLLDILPERLGRVSALTLQLVEQHLLMKATEALQHHLLAMLAVDEEITSTLTTTTSSSLAVPSAEEESAIFKETANTLIAEDLLREDDLQANVKWLDGELREAENDTLCLAVHFAEALLKVEQNILHKQKETVVV